MTATRLTPTASRSGSPKPRVRSGTMSTPPPSPSRDPKIPGADARRRSATRRSPASGTARRDPLGHGAALGAEVLGRVRQQRDVAGALERDGQLALVPGAGAGLAARLDLGALGQVAAQAVDLLVVDLDGLVGAEGADLAAASVAVVVVALLGSGWRAAWSVQVSVRSGGRIVVGGQKGRSSKFAVVEACRRRPASPSPAGRRAAGSADGGLRRPRSDVVARRGARGS